MPALLAPLIGFALGALLAWVRGLERSDDGDEPFFTRASSIVLLFAALAFAPACGYFLFFSADWAYAYLLDTREIPSALELLLTIADAASVMLGFALARRQIRARSAFGTLALAGAPAALALTLGLALLPRLRVDATFRQFRGDFGAEPLAGGPLGYAVLWMNGMLVAGVVVAARALRQRGPRVRRLVPAASSDHPAATHARLLGTEGRGRGSRPD